MHGATTNTPHGPPHRPLGDRPQGLCYNLCYNLLAKPCLCLAFFLGLSGPVWADGPPQLLGLPTPLVPADNPQTPEKIALGKVLFEDKRLSADGTVSCSTCHDPRRAFTDGRTVAQGAGKRRGTRNTPTLWNAAFYASFFWDGRRPSLEAQAQDPLTNPAEHGLGDVQAVLTVIRRDSAYQRLFSAAFNVRAADITFDLVARALAAFERSLIAGNSAFDRYEYGKDPTALSEPALRGLALFRGKALCGSCHTIGPYDASFTDNIFHNLGIGSELVDTSLFQALNALRTGLDQGMTLDGIVFRDKRVSALGRMLADSKRKRSNRLGFKTLGSFKTPTLRNVALTAPYMHDGSLATLEDVVDFIDRGNESGNNIDPLFRPLNLTPQDKVDIVAFLNSLTSATLTTPQQE